MDRKHYIRIIFEASKHLHYRRASPSCIISSGAELLLATCIPAFLENFGSESALPPLSYAVPDKESVGNEDPKIKVAGHFFSF